MERLEHESEVKSQFRYSETFKRMVCEESLEGKLSIWALERKYKLGNTIIKGWLKAYGYEVKKVYSHIIPTMPEEKTAVISSLPTQSQQVISDQTLVTANEQQLRKELEQARLEALAWKKLVDVAERDLKIEIVKKSVTKP